MVEVTQEWIKCYGIQNFQRVLSLLNVSPISLFAEPTPVVAEEEMQMGAPEGH